MALPRTRKEFKEYCLRKLGHPVIQINVSDEQIDDRVDEALTFWNDYHYNGSDLVYLKHLLTQEEIDQGYVDLNNTEYANLLGVVRIFDLSSSISTGTGMFNVQYQFVLNNLQDLTGYSIQNYYMTMSHIRFIQEWLVGLPLIRYNKHTNKLYIDQSKAKLTPGYFIIIEAYAPIDETNPDIWGDRFLQNYTSALIKEQWGSNITKFSNMQLVGGVQFNGEQILSDAREERRNMEDEAKKLLQPLVYNMSG
jgi:hypothetical protein